MKRFLINTLALLLTMVAVPALAQTGSNPYAGVGEPHANLRFNGGLRVQGLIPLYLHSVNDQVTLKKGADVVQLKPGDYTLVFRSRGLLNRGSVPDSPLVRRGTTAWRETDASIEITLEAGKVYFIAGKPHGDGAWTAIVWQEKDAG